MSQYESRVGVGGQKGLPEGTYQPDGSYLYKHPIPARSIKNPPKTFEELLSDPQFVLTCVSLVISICVFFYYLKKLLQAAVADRNDRVANERKLNRKREEKKRMRTEERRRNDDQHADISKYGEQSTREGAYSNDSSSKVASTTPNDKKDGADFEVFGNVVSGVSITLEKRIAAIERGLSEKRKGLADSMERRLRENMEAAQRSQTREELEAAREDEQYAHMHKEIQVKIDTSSKKLERYRVIQEFVQLVAKRDEENKKGNLKPRGEESVNSSGRKTISSLSAEDSAMLEGELRRRGLSLEADKEDKDDSREEDTEYVITKYRDRVRLATEAKKRMELERDQVLLIRAAQEALRAGTALKEDLQR